MLTGKVKWFNNAKGYGFILADDGGDDLFVHYSSIQMPGYKTLKAGQLVTFDTTPGEKGLHAIDITPISTEDVESMKGLQGAEQQTQHHSNTEQPVSSATQESKVSREVLDAAAID